MSTPSENTSRIAQHLSKFVYEPGRRSPHKSASASIGVIEAVKAEPHPPLVVSSSVPITPSPKRKRDVVPGDHSATKENRTENEIRRSEGNTTLDSSDLSDISESTDRSSKRRRSRQAISSKNKAKKIPRSYADPSVYAHLNLLPDMLKEDLDVVFCGINPGKMSATRGHHFAHPTNKFWPGLHNGGFTDRRFTADDDHLMPDLFNFGLTNLVPRPTSEAAELSVHEMRASVPSLLEKLYKYRPKLVCFVGKGIWDKFENIVSKASDCAEIAWTDFTLDNVQVIPGDIKPDNVKLEIDTVSTELVTVTGIEEIRDAKPPISPARSTIASGRSGTAKAKTPFNWTQPRPYKLVHPPTVRGESYATLFWVVPSTSGLERTSREDLWRYFTLARLMSERIKADTVDLGMFRTVNMDRVYAEVERIKQKKESRDNV